MTEEASSPRVPSTIERVCVFRRGAVVTRRLEVPEGAPAVVLAGLPMCLDDASVRVESDGAVHATSVRVTLTTVLPPTDDALAPATDEELGAAERALRKLEAEEALLRESVGAWQRMTIPGRAVRRDDPPEPSPHEARMSLVRLRERRLAALHEALDARRKELLEARERHGELSRRRQADTSAREPRPDELRKAIEVRLDAPPGAPCPLRVSYEVPGARWLPSYVLRIDETSRRAHLSLRAMVAQRTGEDWSAVQLGVSTARPTRFIELPDLGSRRIGRAQRRFPDRGWRPPPPDTATLLDDYRRAVASLPPQPPAKAEVAGAPYEDVDDEAVTGSYAVGAPGAAAAPMASLEVAAEMVPEGAGAATPMAAGAPPPAAQRMLVSESMVRSRAPKKGGFGLGGGPVDELVLLPAEPIAEPPMVAPNADWLNYGGLRLPPPDRTSGQLQPWDAAWQYTESMEIDVTTIRVALRRSLEVSTRVADPPARYVPPEPDDSYDYAYAAEAPVDVPADGAFHNVPICGAPADMAVSLAVVPRASTDAYRQAELDNPLLGPLLRGPVDVYVGRDFFTSSEVRFTPPGGKLRLGLGVAQGLKVARNARYHESSAGLMGGALVLHHDVEIDLASHLDRPTAVEVRERLPVLREKEDDIKLTVRDVDPAWESYDPPDESLRGGQRWRLSIDPGETRRLTFGYDIRISSKNELVGGNRRED